MTALILSFKIIETASFIAWRFHPLLGSGMKKLPLIKRDSTPLSDISLLFANPAEGIFDLSFLYNLNQSVDFVLYIFNPGGISFSSVLSRAGYVA